MRPDTIIGRGIDEAIYACDKLMLVLSQHALTSGWVAYEVEMALHKERERNVQVLFPLGIDDAIMTCTEMWAKHLCTRHIADFTKPHEYQNAFAHLLRHLKATFKT